MLSLYYIILPYCQIILYYFIHISYQIESIENTSERSCISIHRDKTVVALGGGYPYIHIYI
jgi:hypothetical protein